MTLVIYIDPSCLDRLRVLNLESLAILHLFGIMGSMPAFHSYVICFPSASGVKLAEEMLRFEQICIYIYIYTYILYVFIYNSYMYCIL